LKILLDTHIALWAITDDPRLPQVAREQILDDRNEIYVSAASVWEIAIKHGLARGRPNDMPLSGEAARGFFQSSGYRMLAISADHAAAVSALPLVHADPFDRILVAQALFEPLHFMTHDKILAAYGDGIWIV